MQEEQVTTTPEPSSESTSRFLSSMEETQSSTSQPQQPAESTRQESVRQEPAEQASVKAGTGQATVEELAADPRVQQRAEQQGIDVNDLAAKIVAAQQEANQRMQEEAARNQPYTEERFKKDFGVVEVGSEQFEALFGSEATPERVQAFNNLLKQTAAMAVKMANYQAQQQISQINQQLSPIQSMVQRVENSALERRFDAKYPQLNKHKEFVSSVLAQMNQSGERFPNVDAAMEAAAKRSMQMLQNAGVNFASPQQEAAPTRQAPANKQPGQLSMGGSVGASKSPSSAQGESKGISVLKASMM